MWLDTSSIKMHCMFPINPQFEESHMIAGGTNYKSLIDTRAWKAFLT